MAAAAAAEVRVRAATPAEVVARDAVMHRSDWGRGWPAVLFAEREAALNATSAWARAGKRAWLAVEHIPGDGSGGEVILGNAETFALPAMVSDDGRRSGRVVQLLTSIFVEPAHRGRGVATAFVRQLAEMLEAEGDCAAVALFSDVGPRLYERCGFVAAADPPRDSLLHVPITAAVATLPADVTLLPSPIAADAGAGAATAALAGADAGWQRDLRLRAGADVDDPLVTCLTAAAGDIVVQTVPTLAQCGWHLAFSEYERHAFAPGAAPLTAVGAVVSSGIGSDGSMVDGTAAADASGLAVWCGDYEEGTLEILRLAVRPLAWYAARARAADEMVGATAGSAAVTPDEAAVQWRADTVAKLLAAAIAAAARSGAPATAAAGDASGTAPAPYLHDVRVWQVPADGSTDGSGAWQPWQWPVAGSSEATHVGRVLSALLPAVRRAGDESLWRVELRDGGLPMMRLPTARGGSAGAAAVHWLGVERGAWN